jgi:hypothetical protein
MTRESTDVETRVLELTASRPTIIFRSYTAGFAQATRTFAEEAPVFEEHGYIPASHSWVPGEWGSGWMTLALVTVFIGIGLILLLGMAAIRPAGTLTVMYRLEEIPGVTTIAPDRPAAR